MFLSDKDCYVKLQIVVSYGSLPLCRLDQIKKTQYAVPVRSGCLLPARTAIVFIMVTTDDSAYSHFVANTIFEIKRLKFNKTALSSTDYLGILVS